MTEVTNPWMRTDRARRAAVGTGLSLSAKRVLPNNLLCPVA